MDILKNTDAMGKRIFADLEKINFILRRKPELPISSRMSWQKRVWKRPLKNLW